MEDGKIFDRARYAARRSRVAAGWREYDFLKREAAARLKDCLDDINRHFPRALNLGAHVGGLEKTLGESGGIETLIETDRAREFHPDIVCDEELLPFAPGSFDLIVSLLSLHHVNDLPGTLIQIRRALKADGLFVAILPGANTLRELRLSFAAAAAKGGFGLSPHVSPFVEVRDAGALLMRAGFAMPVADSDTVQVEYEDVPALLGDLRGGGENNILLSRHKGLTTPRQMAMMAGQYRAQFALPGGGIAATFEFITMTGWKPA